MNPIPVRCINLKNKIWEEKGGDRLLQHAVKLKFALRHKASYIDWL